MSILCYAEHNMAVLYTLGLVYIVSNERIGMDMENPINLDSDSSNETQEDRYSRLNAVLSVLLCVFAVILTCCFIVLMVIRSMGVGHIIRHINVIGAIEETSVGFQPNSIVDQINAFSLSDFEVSLYDIEEFIKLEAVTDELDNVIDAYALAFTMGNLDYHISTDEVIAIARRLEPELYDFFGYRLAEEDLEFLVLTLDDMIDFTALSIDGIMEDYDVDLTVPLVLISPALIWVVGIVITGLLAFIFIRKRKDPISASFAVGIPVTISGSLVFLTGLVVGSNPTMLGDTSLVFVRMVEHPIYLATRYGLFFTAAGVLILIGVFIFKKVAQRKLSGEPAL